MPCLIHLESIRLVQWTPDRLVWVQMMLFLDHNSPLKVTPAPHPPPPPQVFAQFALTV